MTPDLFIGQPRAALISSCGRYRYTLTRRWSPSPASPAVLWVMFNPSTADAEADDPTIRRVVDFTRRLFPDAGGLIVANLFALRSTDPKGLFGRHEEARGPDNDQHLNALAQTHEQIVVAWGRWDMARQRGLTFAAACRIAGHPPKCLGKNADGSPKHPLYLRADKSLEDWP